MAMPTRESLEKRIYELIDAAVRKDENRLPRWFLVGKGNVIHGIDKLFGSTCILSIPGSVRTSLFILSVILPIQDSGAFLSN